MSKATEILMKINEGSSHMIKFKDEKDLHTVYKAFKATGTKVVVDPKALLLQVNREGSTDDMTKWIMAALPDAKDSAFEIRSK